MKSLSIEKLDTDVLVIGAGAGGMMAAISAADQGVDVTLCEKGNARRSGGITAGNDHFFCYIPEIHGEAAREHFISSLQEGGPVERVPNIAWRGPSGSTAGLSDLVRRARRGLR